MPRRGCVNGRDKVSQKWSFRSEPVWRVFGNSGMLPDLIRVPSKCMEVKGTVAFTSLPTAVCESSAPTYRNFVMTVTGWIPRSRTGMYAGGRSRMLEPSPRDDSTKNILWERSAASLPQKKTPLARGKQGVKGSQLRETGSCSYFYRLFLQGDKARAPLAAITTWMIRKKISSVIMLPPP